ncbi:MAG: DUF86 domain-containing protein [Bacteroidetes bacterium]|nr:DUF86 domain-containing protein [Bacteroidota bacterium]
MSHSQLELLRHILSETDFVLENTANKSETQIINDSILSRALVRSLEIIGEATKKLPDEVVLKYPEINWKDMARTRDKLIHHYSGVDYAIIWDIICNELPELKFQIENIITEESKQ